MPAIGCEFYIASTLKKLLTKNFPDMLHTKVAVFERFSGK